MTAKHGSACDVSISGGNFVWGLRTFAYRVYVNFQCIYRAAKPTGFFCSDPLLQLFYDERSWTPPRVGNGARAGIERRSFILSFVVLVSLPGNEACQQASSRPPHMDATINKIAIYPLS